MTNNFSLVVTCPESATLLDTQKTPFVVFEKDYVYVVTKGLILCLYPSLPLLDQTQASSHFLAAIP